MDLKKESCKCCIFKKNTYGKIIKKQPTKLEIK